jgi:arsenate reductase (thioredoxin)
MKKRVLILCTGNSARSQMAEGLLRARGGDRYEVESAGSKPSIVRPEAIEAMDELGIDLRGHRSKHVDEFAGQHFDLVITVCDHARDVCPVFPSSTQMLHWGFEDPVVGDVESFRRIRDQIALKFDEWLKG